MKTINWKQLTLFLFLVFGMSSLSMAQSSYTKKKASNSSQSKYKKTNNGYGKNEKKPNANEYKYDKTLSMKASKSIAYNKYLSNDIRDLKKYGIEGKKYVETNSIILAMEPSHILLMTSAGMTQLYKGKYITEKEHGILMNLLHKDGYSKSHYAEYQNYRKYSTRVAEHIFMNLKDYCPRVTSSNRYKVKRGNMFRNHMIKIIMGSFTATDDLAKVKKMRKGYDAFNAGYGLAGKVFKYVKLNYNNRYQKEYGFKPAPDGQGDGDYRRPSRWPFPQGGWPWSMIN